MQLNSLSRVIALALISSVASLAATISSSTLSINGVSGNGPTLVTQQSILIGGGWELLPGATLSLTQGTFDIDGIPSDTLFKFTNVDAVCSEREICGPATLRFFAIIDFENPVNLTTIGSAILQLSGYTDLVFFNATFAGAGGSGSTSVFTNLEEPIGNFSRSQVVANTSVNAIESLYLNASIFLGSAFGGSRFVLPDSYDLFVNTGGVGTSGVPEPATFGLLALGLAGGLWAQRRRR
jgi:hypothetical protein